jgi:hypothetical protein
MVGNLAWAPLPAFEEVEVLDRFNGVPTLGVFGSPGDKTLFWRVSGYVPQSGEFSVWLYVPLEPGEEERVDSAEPDDLLTGLIFNAEAPRWATVGMAQDNRLRYEFRWKLPRATQPRELTRLVSEFAESSKSLQDEPGRSSALPPIVEENKQDKAIMQIWETDVFSEEQKLTLIRFALAIRDRRKDRRRGA